MTLLRLVPLDDGSKDCREPLLCGTPSKSIPRPEYLCRALDVLAATRPLAIRDKDAKQHQILSETHQVTLAARHPGHTCEVGTELRPTISEPSTSTTTTTGDDSVLNDGRTQTQPPIVPGPSRAATPGSKNTDAPRENRAPFALTTAGAVATTFGVAALAAMVGGFVVRSQTIKATGPLDEVKRQKGEFTVEQGYQRAALTDAGNAARQVALAGGISGAFLLVLGVALIGRGQVLRARTRVVPMAAPGRAGLFVEGRF